MHRAAIARLALLGWLPLGLPNTKGWYSRDRNLFNLSAHGPIPHLMWIASLSRGAKIAVIPGGLQLDESHEGSWRSALSGSEQLTAILAPREKMKAIMSAPETKAALDTDFGLFYSACPFFSTMTFSLAKKRTAVCVLCTSPL